MPEMAMFDPVSLFLVALLNPAVILVGVLMGRSCDQWQKLILAGFAAALAGAIVTWLAVRLGILEAQGAGGSAGVFIFSFFLGTAWAALAYALKTRRAS